MKTRKPTLTQRYPNSKKIWEAMPKKVNKKVGTCKCGNIDYKSLVYVTKKAIHVIENLAEAVNTMEKKFSVNEHKVKELLVRAHEREQETAEMIRDYNALREYVDELKGGMNAN